MQKITCLAASTTPKRELVGNFPQAFSHIGLINAALSLKAGTSVRLKQLNNRRKQGLTRRTARASNGRKKGLDMLYGSLPRRQKRKKCGVRPLRASDGRPNS